MYLQDIIVPWVKRVRQLSNVQSDISVRREALNHRHVTRDSIKMKPHRVPVKRVSLVRFIHKNKYVNRINGKKIK